MAKSNRSSNGGVLDMARERPFAAAATAAGAAAAGLFLWSKRTQISDQLSDLSEKFGQWTESMRANGDGDDTKRSGRPTASDNRRSTSRRKAASGEAEGIEETPPG